MRNWQWAEQKIFILQRSNWKNTFLPNKRTPTSSYHIFLYSLGLLGISMFRQRWGLSEHSLALQHLIQVNRMGWVVRRIQLEDWTARRGCEEKVDTHQLILGFHSFGCFERSPMLVQRIGLCRSSYAAITMIGNVSSSTSKEYSNTKWSLDRWWMRSRCSFANSIWWWLSIVSARIWCLSVLIRIRRVSCWKD